MYKKNSELRREKLVYGGKEQGEFIHLAEKEDLCDKVRFFAITKIEPGKEIGYHQHLGEKEIFYILEGCGEINDNGNIVNVSAGDVVITPIDGWHSFKNTGNGDFAFIALIIRNIEL